MFEVFEQSGRRYARFAHLARQAGLRHAYTTRGLDVSARRDARSDRRSANRARAVQDLGLDPTALCYCVQVHQTRLVTVRPPVLGGPLEGVDALITAARGATLMTFSADCPLVIVYDPRTPALGLAHASWRCTVAALTGRLVSALREEFGARPEHLLAGVGPAAGPCCYEVGPDVYAAAAELPERARLFVRRNGRLYFDLWEANRQQLLAAGLPAEHVATADCCTLCRNELFYSFRREGPGCGHFGLLAGLMP